ncbi:MAG: c-type cytochrome [Methylophilaceae bacterium]
MSIEKVIISSIFVGLATLSAAAQAAEINALSATENLHIRTLAASCAACHGSHGNSAGVTPVLAGLDASYFSTQMIAFKNGERAATVMHRHAKGLNIDEIYQLALHFSQQKRAVPSLLKSQPLKANHE